MSHNTTFRGSVLDAADMQTIQRLASDTESDLPEGPVLLAEIDGEPVAVIGIADGRTLRDTRRANVAVRTRLRLERRFVRLVHAVWGV